MSEIITGKPVLPTSNFYPDKTDDDTANEHFDRVGNHIDAIKRQQYINLHKSQPYTIVDDQSGWRGSTFWEVTMGGDKIIMQYNLAHVFHKELK